MTKFSLSLFFLSLAYLVNAQQFLTFSDSKEKINYRAISEGQISYLFTIYNQRMDISNELINGRDYIRYYNRSESKPLLFDEKKRSGTLILNGRKYDNLSLEYDTYLDELIYSDRTKVFADKSLMISLNKDPVDGFKLYFDDDSLIFRHLKSGDDIKFNLPEGFYEVVYDGNCKYIIKHQSSLTQTKSIDEYLYSTANYIKVGENFFRVRTKKGLVKLFGEKSKEIKKFMRTSKIHNHKLDKMQIASVLMFYDAAKSSNKQPE
jgi:hypothetical protein